MSTRWALLVSVWSLGFVGALQAHPMDSPDIVYVDGMPCNSACQSYMAWSRQMLTASRRPESTQLARHSTDAAARHTTGTRAERLKPRASAHVAKQAVPMPGETPRTGVAVLEPADSSAPKSDAKSDTTPAKIADSPAVVSPPATTGIRTIRELVVAAITFAEHVTAASSAPAPQQKSNDADPSDHAGGAPSSDPEKTAASPDNSNLVALLMVRSEIKSVSDLAGKDIAIEDGQSASGASIRTAISAAGAPDAQLSESHARAIDRLVGGEVPAAVLALVSPEAAEWFPEIKGFKLFRIALSSRS